MTATYAQERAAAHDAARPLPILRFNPNHTDLERWFGPLETPIMRAMWDADIPRTVKGVWNELRGQGYGIAYTTVMTTMTRLYQKAILHREKRGASFSYMPRETRDAFEKRQIVAIVGSLESER